MKLQNYEYLLISLRNHYMNFKWVRCDLLINNNRVLYAGMCKENPLASLRVHITFAQPYNW